MAQIKLEIYNFPRLCFFGGEMPLDRSLFYNQLAKRSKAIQIVKHWGWQGERPVISDPLPLSEKGAALSQRFGAPLETI
jgi:hypothetical protein